MSVFRAFIRERLARKNPQWVSEWDDVFRDGRADDVLLEVAKLGADPDFCVFILAEYRWRNRKPLPRRWERKRLLTAVTTLGKLDGFWKETLEHACRGLEWAQVREFLGRAQDLLQLAVELDEGTFTTTTTDKRGQRWLSERQSTCLYLLDQHIKRQTGQPRSRSQILVDLMEAFDFLPAGRLKKDPAGGLKDPEGRLEDPE